MGNPANFEATIEPSSVTAEQLLELAMHYCLGKGVSQNLVAAHKWFNIAALKGSTAARQYRCELAREMSPNDVALAQREARDWLTVH
jgi:TPR repeat protein